jgi:hypothetical protein
MECEDIEMIKVRGSNIIKNSPYIDVGADGESHFYCWWY